MALTVEFKSLVRSRRHEVRGDWTIAASAMVMCCLHNHVHLAHTNLEDGIISELVMSPPEAYALAHELLRAYDIAEDIL
jgi:hypothetical protein